MVRCGPRSVVVRRVVQARSARERLRALCRLRPSDIRLYIPEVKNRVTGRSMGEHTEDMAKDWKVGRLEQVVVNLLTNALRYGAGKPIRVELTQLPGAAMAYRCHAAVESSALKGLAKA